MYKKLSAILFLVVSLITTFYYPKVALAQGILCTGGDSVNTALGCIPAFDVNGLTVFALRLAVGIGGGIAFLLIAYSGFMTTTSSGNPERLKAGRELLTSAIMGLLMLIFSIFILRIIGVNILKIPGFGA